MQTVHDFAGRQWNQQQSAALVPNIARPGRSIWSKSKLQDGMTPYSWGPGNLLLQRRDLAVATARVAPQFFATLDVKAALGRTFAPDDVQSCPDCVLLSYPVWHTEIMPTRTCGRTDQLEWIAANGDWRASRRLSANFLRDSRLGPHRSSHAVYQLPAPWGQWPACTLTRYPTYRANWPTSPKMAAISIHRRRLQVTTVSSQMRRNLWYAVWFVMLAVGCAILVVVLRHATSGFVDLPEGFRDRTLWLAFFAAKSGQLLTIAGLPAWSTVHWIANWVVGSRIRRWTNIPSGCFCP